MNRNTLRFSIAFILFVCLCLAGFLAGNRSGFREGYATGKAKSQSEEPFPTVYEVGDIIRTSDGRVDRIGAQLDYDSLIAAAQASVFPDEWEALGGPCTMVPVPQLESLVVNATSGVHDGLRALLADLSSVKRAMAVSNSKQKAMQRARDEWVAGIVGPVSQRLGTELTLVNADINLIGSWDVQRNMPDGMTSTSQYVFIDADTVRITTPDDAGSSMDVRYFVVPGSVVVSGMAYTAATTTDSALVLIPNNDPQKFLIATRIGGEP